MPALVVDVSDLGPGQTRAVEEAGVQVLVCNAQGRFYAIENRCPHATVRLDTAALEGCLLECPVHGGRLDVRDGSPAGRPIRTPVQTFAVRADGARVEIDIPEPEEDTTCTTS